MSIELKKNNQTTTTTKISLPCKKKNHPWLLSGNGIGEGKLIRRISNH